MKEKGGRDKTQGGGRKEPFRWEEKEITTGRGLLGKKAINRPASTRLAGFTLSQWKTKILLRAQGKLCRNKQRDKVHLEKGGE